MFPVAPETGRRRNARLYEEWLEATARSENGRKSAENRWNGKNGCDRNAIAMPSQSDRNAQTKPIQTKSSQEEESATPPAQPSDPKTLRVIFRQEARRKLTFDDGDWDQYVRACKEHTEEKILQYFREWAQEKKHDFKERSSYPLKWFLKDLDVMIEGDAVREEDAAPTEDEMRVVQAEIDARKRDMEQTMAKAKAEEDRLRQHYPDDSFCACPQCQPDFWKDRE